MPRQRGTHLSDSIEPSLAPERAIRELHAQLEGLSAFEGCRWREIRSEEEEWMQVTEDILTRAFGKPSGKLSHFYRARAAGRFSMGISDRQLQESFEERLRSYKPVLRSSIRALELSFPEEEIKGAYAPGEQYDFYRDLKNLISLAKAKVLIVDPYLDDTHFELYVEKIPKGVDVRVLFDQTHSAKTSPALIIVAKKFSSGRSFELRTTNAIHDRIVFIDDRVWVIGQSLKDAAGKKPTYIVETGEVQSMKAIYEGIWSASKRILP